MTIRNGRDIAAERARRNITQGQLADALGVYRSTIVDLENKPELELSDTAYDLIAQKLNEIASEDAA